MTTFSDILTGEEEDLVKIFYSFQAKENPDDNRNNLAAVAKKLKLSPEQLIISFGFNRNSKGLDEIYTVLGYENLEKLTKDRNKLYINYVYQNISLENILMLYSIIKDANEMLQVMNYL